MDRLRADVLRAAVGEGLVVVVGEPGSGKSLVARALHEQGPHPDRPCAIVPCGSLADGLLEVELFGCRGTGSAATGNQRGLIETVDGGTVILENIEMIGGRTQALLESFLQCGRIHTSGTSDFGVPIATRIVATTSPTNGPSSESPTWWAPWVDTTVTVPTLRERRSDIPLLLHLFASASGVPPDVTFSQDAVTALKSYSWPGNVSQLRSVVERLVAGSAGEVRSKDLPVGIRPRQDQLGQGIRPSVGEELFSRIQTTGDSFWSAVYPLFMKREITRTDLRDLISRAFQKARGNAEELVHLLNMPASDRQKFARFLRKYGCELHIGL
jgi:sigma-54 specific flagellar transcriptional regulator A